MDARQKQLKYPELRVEDIQYLPDHRCPQCNAPARTTESGAWIRPYEDWFGTALRYWQDHLGYVYFQCNCQHHPEFRWGLRVARLGDAILPIHFADVKEAYSLGMEPAALNAERTRHAVSFLAAHADPGRSAGTDWLAHTLYALAAGGTSPERVRKELHAWIEDQVNAVLEGSPIVMPVTRLADNHLTEQVSETYASRKEAR